MSDSTYNEALKVADDLLMEGTRPTQQRVRERLGRGSLTTINKALNDWWANLGPRLARKDQIPDIPAALAASVHHLWEEALRHAAREQQQHLVDAQERIRALRKELKAVRERQQEEREQLHRQLAEQLALNAEQQARIGRMQEEMRALEERLYAQEKEITAKNREIETLNETLARLRKC